LLRAFLFEANWPGDSGFTGSNATQLLKGYFEEVRGYMAHRPNGKMVILEQSEQF
jgi:hypothetical protein